MVSESKFTRLEFEIPSIHQNAPLACRIFHPDTFPTRGQESVKGAIIAHPYAPLGGSYDDPVVNQVAEVLLNAGFMVGTFNFRRGVWPSKHRTSWTSRPEQKDFISFASFFVLFLLEKHFANHDPALGTSCDVKGLEIIFSGYSYGSMIASCIPPIQNTSSLFSDDLDEARRIDLHNRAKMLISENIVVKRKTSEHLKDVDSVPNYNYPVESCYLFISPIVPPVTWALAINTGNPFSDTSSADKMYLWQHRTLAIFGSRDVFAPREKLLHWAEDLHSRTGSKFSYKEIQTAGHFWHEVGTLSSLKTAVKAWIQTEAAAGTRHT